MREAATVLSTDLWQVQIPLIEKVLRTVLVYGGLAVLLRVGGKRSLAQLNSFDLVVMLLLSNVVQNAVIGPDNSLAGGLLGAAVLVAINALVVRSTNRHPRLIRLFEGAETVIIEDGRPLRRVIRRLGLRVADVTSALRHQGADDVSEVHRATLAPGGSIVVTLKDEAQDATRGDLQREYQRLLDELRTEIRSSVADLEERLLARLDAGTGRDGG